MHQPEISSIFNKLTRYLTYRIFLGPFLLGGLFDGSSLRYFLWAGAWARPFLPPLLEDFREKFFSSRFVHLCIGEFGNT